MWMIVIGLGALGGYLLMKKQASAATPADQAAVIQKNITVPMTDFSAWPSDYSQGLPPNHLGQKSIVLHGIGGGTGYAIGDIVLLYAGDGSGFKTLQVSDPSAIMLLSPDSTGTPLSAGAQLVQLKKPGNLRFYAETVAGTTGQYDLTIKGS